MVAAEAVKLKRAAGDLVEAENKQIALWSELVVTSGVNLQKNHRFEFAHLAANVDLTRIGGRACSFFCPSARPGASTLDRRSG
jgi:hypothetical protein